MSSGSSLAAGNSKEDRSLGPGVGGDGLLVVLSGPSGVGKDTVLRRAMDMEPGLRYSVSFTTRPPREGEVDGTSYSFVDESAFQAMAEGGELLEWAQVHGHLYGTSLARVAGAVDRGEAIALKIDVQGAAQVRSRLAAGELPRRFAGAGLFVFLLPPTTEELQRRLLARDSDDVEAVDRRLGRATAELAEAGRYDHRIVNDDVDRAARELLYLIAARRQGASSGSPAR
ncbi:MAG: guanylate kinase [Candidatus Dormibacteria bacterium]